MQPKKALEELQKLIAEWDTYDATEVWRSSLHETNLIGYMLALKDCDYLEEVLRTLAEHAEIEVGYENSTRLSGGAWRCVNGHNNPSSFIHCHDCGETR